MVIANKITTVSKNLLQNHSWTVTNKNNQEIPKERSTSPEERQKIIDNNGTSKNNKFVGQRTKSSD